MEAKSNAFVIILAAGYATRLRPLSNKIPKSLINIYGIPLISRIISNFNNSGFSRFCVVVGYKKELVKKEVLKNKDIEIEFVEQKELTGMVEAIYLSIKYINQKYDNITHFFVTAGDIIPQTGDILKMYSLYINSQADIILSLMISNDPEIAKGHGNVKISIEPKMSSDTDINYGLKIIDVIEKPYSFQILSDYYSLPLYFLNQKILKHLENVKFSERGEKEFQDALKNAILNGDDVRGIRVIDTKITKDNIGKYHLTNLKDIIKMNNRISSGINLEKFKGKSPQFIEPVKIEFGTKIGNKVLLGPYAIIGRYCEIDDNCELSDVIIFDNVKIEKFCRLNWCIVDEAVILPEKFHTKDCFITKNDKKELEIINF